MITGPLEGNRSCRFACVRLPTYRRNNLRQHHSHAGGLTPNLSIPFNRASMTGRHPIIGYGTSFVPQPNYGGAGRDNCRATKFDPNSQFEGCTDNIRAGNTTLKRPK